MMMKEGIKKVKLLKSLTATASMSVIANTMGKDAAKSTEDALEII